MTGWRKILGWGALLAAGVVLVGLGVFIGVARLDEADKWGSVIGALVALLGLPMTMYGIVLARRQGGDGAGGQSVSDSTIGGGVTQVRGVRGNVRIGSAVTPASAAPAPPAPPAPAPAPAPVGLPQGTNRLRLHLRARAGRGERARSSVGDRVVNGGPGAADRRRRRRCGHRPVIWRAPGRRSRAASCSAQQSRSVTSPAMSRSWRTGPRTRSISCGPTLAMDAAREQPSRLLLARHQVLPFTGRDTELDEMNAWMSGGETISVQLIHAAGGQGKTRLARHVAAQAHTAGWVTWRVLHTPRQQPSSHMDVPAGGGALIVIDYADRWPAAAISTALTRHRLAATASPPPPRRHHQPRRTGSAARPPSAPSCY